MEENTKAYYKYCIVPMCENNVKTAPDKIYFYMPRDANIRKKWCKAMRRDNVSCLSSLYCCEDHFDIEKDTENYIKYKIMALEHGQKVSLLLKKGVIPHIFQCQKKDKLLPPERKCALKRKRQALIEEALAEAALFSKPANTSDPSTTTPPAAKRTSYVLEKEMIPMDTVNKDNNLQQDQDPLTEINIISCKPESGVLDEPHIKKELPLQPDLRCQVCNNDIIGFRYTCVQCTHWDMCASCEARGEHPAHYVLRLPAPKPYVECEPVIAAIREHIQNLLLLCEEIKSEVDSKEEIYMAEMTEEFDPYLTDPLQAAVGREVPELNIYQQSSTKVNRTDLEQDTRLAAPKLDCTSPTVDAPRLVDNQIHSRLNCLAKECTHSKKRFPIILKPRRALRTHAEGNQSDCN